MPVYRKHLGTAGVWNIFWNNFEEYATTNETDFMGSVTMSPASGRQKFIVLHVAYFCAWMSFITLLTPFPPLGYVPCPLPSLRTRALHVIFAARSTITFCPSQQRSIWLRLMTLVVDINYVSLAAQKSIIFSAIFVAMVTDSSWAFPRRLQEWNAGSEMLDRHFDVKSNRRSLSQMISILFWLIKNMELKGTAK